MNGPGSTKVAFYGTTTEGEIVAQEFALDGKSAFSVSCSPNVFKT
jgi:hypothetical protein